MSVRARITSRSVWRTSNPRALGNSMSKPRISATTASGAGPRRSSSTARPTREPPSRISTRAARPRDAGRPPGSTTRTSRASRSAALRSTADGGTWGSGGRILRPSGGNAAMMPLTPARGKARAATASTSWRTRSAPRSCGRRRGRRSRTSSSTRPPARAATAGVPPPACRKGRSSTAWRWTRVPRARGGRCS